jgi:tRNA A37 methylthiotransferase MiaB
MSTSMPPLTLTGIISYSHFAPRKDTTAQSQTAMPHDTVTKRVGRRIMRAVPTQKREKRRAVVKEMRMVATEKEAKRARGRKEKASWM